MFLVIRTYIYNNVIQAMRFGNCTTLQVSGLKHVNSPRNHVTLYYCKGVNIANIHINAPQTSPNTDGINIGHSTDIHIHDSIIETGNNLFDRHFLPFVLFLYEQYCFLLIYILISYSYRKKVMIVLLLAAVLQM